MSMNRNAFGRALTVAIVLFVSLLPLGALSTQAASLAHSVAQPAPPARGHIYFYCNWLGKTIRLKHVPTVPVERLADAKVVGRCGKLRTNDHYYHRLSGRTINVFIAPREYPGVLIVRNGRQGRQPVYGNWTFPFGVGQTGTLQGTVTDQTSTKPITGATVRASQCFSSPTKHCTIHTVDTDARGKFSIHFFLFGKWVITVTAPGYAASASMKTTIRAGRTTAVHIALVRQPTAISLSLGATPVPVAVNGTATLTATLSQPVTDGTITFTGAGPAGATFTTTPTACTPANGVCTVSWQPSAVGSWIITASYSGDSTYASATNTLTVSVTALTTTLQFAGTPISPAVGSRQTLTATLGAQVSGGTVTFTFSGPNGGTAASQSCTPAAGSCSATWSPPTAGVWTVNASWTGNGQYGPASSTLTINVSGGALTLSLVSSPAAPNTGQSTTLTAYLSQPVNDGTVSFSGSGPSGGRFTVSSTSCIPSGGTCHITWTPTTPGTWTITGTWSGDTQYSGATGSTTATVGQGTTTMTLTETPPILAVNQQGTLTATLAAPVNDGTVSFSDVGPNSVSVATTPSSCTPVNGACSVTWKPTAAGTWSVSAFWSGDSSFSPTAKTIQVIVSGSSSTMTLTNSPSQIAVNDTGTITATLTSGASAQPITMSFNGPNGAVLGNQTCVPTNGSCFVSWTPTMSGTWTISGYWPGQGSTGPATQTIQVTVSPAGYLTLSVTPNPITVNSTGQLRATVQSAADTGPVTFTETPPNGSTVSTACALANGSCTANWTPTSPGVWTITALWGGDYSHPQSASDTSQVTVTGLSDSLNLTASPSNPNANQATTLTATVTPAVTGGTVSFSGSDTTGDSFTTSPTTCTVSTGSCTVQWFPSNNGSWTVTASWAGTNQYSPASDTITVNVGSGGLTVTSNPTSPTSGQAATLTATLAAGETGGTITFYGVGPNGQGPNPSGATCNIQYASNSCSVNWTPDVGGNWSINASWSGDVNHPNGASTTVTIFVQQATFSVSASPNPGFVNGQETVTATFANTSVTLGSVTFIFYAPGGTYSVGQCTPSGGTCQDSTDWKPNVTGNWRVQANYSGGQQVGFQQATITVPVQ